MWRTTWQAHSDRPYPRLRLDLEDPPPGGVHLLWARGNEGTDVKIIMSPSTSRAGKYMINSSNQGLQLVNLLAQRKHLLRDTLCGVMGLH